MPASVDELRRLNETVQKLNERLAGIENKLVATEGQNLNDRLAATETKNATLDNRLNTFDGQRLNDRLTGMETKVVALENQKLNDRLTTMEAKNSALDARLNAFDGQKLNDRLTAFETQRLNERLTAAEAKNAALDNRLTTMEAKFVALENQKLHDRLTTEEAKHSNLDIQVSFYVKAGLICAAVLLGLWGVTGVASFALIPSSAKQHTEEAVAKAIKELNVPDAIKKEVTGAIKDMNVATLVNNEVRPRLDAAIKDVPRMVSDSVDDTLATATRQAVNNSMKNEGRQIILKTVTEVAKGDVRDELIKQVRDAQTFILDTKQAASSALQVIEKAKQEVKAFDNQIGDTNRAVNELSVKSEDLNHRLTAFEGQRLNDRLADVQRMLGRLEAIDSWQWFLGIGCFVGLLGLIAVAVIQRTKKPTEVKKLNEVSEEVTKLNKLSEHAKKLSDGMLHLS